MIKQRIKILQSKINGLIDIIRQSFDNLALKNIHTCDTITLISYCKLICYNNLNLLKKAHVYTSKRILMQGFTNLLHEYNNLTENKEVRIRTELSKKIDRYKKRYIEILAAYTVLRYQESIESILILKRHFVIDGSEPKKAILQKCVSTLKGLKVELSTMELKYEKTAAKGRMMMSDFDKEKAFLKRKGYDIKDDMKLSEYIQVQNLLRTEYEEEKKQIERLKNGAGNHR